ncbi:hypothetical protein IWX50DRAFT_679548 [Phyllosticta citricarpa]
MLIARELVEVVFSQHPYRNLSNSQLHRGHQLAFPNTLVTGFKKFCYQLCLLKRDFTAYGKGDPPEKQPETPGTSKSPVKKTTLEKLTPTTPRPSKKGTAVRSGPFYPEVDITLKVNHLLRPWVSKSSEANLKNSFKDLQEKKKILFKTVDSFKTASEDEKMVWKRREMDEGRKFLRAAAQALSTLAAEVRQDNEKGNFSELPATEVQKEFARCSQLRSELIRNSQLLEASTQSDAVERMKIGGSQLSDLQDQRLPPPAGATVTFKRDVESDEKYRKRFRQELLHEHKADNKRGQWIQMRTALYEDSDYMADCLDFSQISDPAEDTFAGSSSFASLFGHDTRSSIFTLRQAPYLRHSTLYTLTLNVGFNKDLGPLARYSSGTSSSEDRSRDSEIAEIVERNHLFARGSSGSNPFAQLMEEEEEEQEEE